jgi:hypothetical protein
MQRILISVFSVCFALGGLAMPVQADSVANLFDNGTAAGCYKRTYDKAHMAKHPNQMVTMIELAYAPATDPAYIEGFGPIAFGLSVLTRSSQNEIVGNVALCRNEGQAVFCGMEGDGGAFIVTRAGPTKIRLDISVELTFETDRFISLGSDDKIFVLEKTAARNCQKP